MHLARTTAYMAPISQKPRLLPFLFVLESLLSDSNLFSFVLFLLSFFFFPYTHVQVLGMGSTRTKRFSSPLKSRQCHVSVLAFPAFRAPPTRNTGTGTGTSRHNRGLPCSLRPFPSFSRRTRQGIQGQLARGSSPIGCPKTTTMADTLRASQR